MDEALELLREILKHTPEVTDKTPLERIDKMGEFKVHWENGVDVRVSIRNLKRAQELLKESK